MSAYRRKTGSDWRVFEVTPMTHSGSRRYFPPRGPGRLPGVQFEQLDCSILVFGGRHATAEFMALVASAATWPLPSWAQQQVSPVFARENLMRRRMRCIWLAQIRARGTLCCKRFVTYGI